MKKSIAAILGSFLLSQIAFGAPPLVVSKNKLWKTRNINIAFVSGTPEERELIKKFAMPWTKYANLNFNFFNSLSEAPGGRAHIRVQISERDEKNPFAGDSYVGTDSLYSGTPYSMRIFIKPGEMLHMLSGIVLHEFGHALGLNHEHQHPERTYEFDEAKLFADCATRGIERSHCERIYTDTYSRWENNILTYDPESIMHYSLDRNYVKSGPEEIFSGTSSLSLLDKIGIARTYPGRISEEEIIADHEAEILKAEQTDSVRGCRFSTFTSGGKTLYTYHNREINYYLGYGIASKVSAVFDAELNPKCDLPETNEPKEEEREIKDVEVDTSDPRETKIKTIYFPTNVKDENQSTNAKCVIVKPGEKTGQLYIDTWTLVSKMYVVANASKKQNMTGTAYKTLEDAELRLSQTPACQ